MDATEFGYDWSLGDNNPHPAHKRKPCSECGNKLKDVFDRASFSGRMLLCRECVSKVEQQRYEEKIGGIRGGYNNES